MALNKTETIHKLVHLPRMFNMAGNISILDLLKNSGYFEMRDQITESDIQISLLANSGCIQDWRTFSENKRSSGWYFRENQNGRFEVGYFAHTGESIKPIEYTNESQACAAFIKREIEELAKQVQRARPNRKANVG